MREIKFRVYQKNFKRMLPVTSIEFECYNNEIESITVYNRGVNGEYYVIPYNSTYIAGDEEFPLDSLVLMQYTGLKDKNGVDIYEGDIVKWIDSDKKERIDTVLWKNGGMILCNQQYTVGVYLFNELVVIGNIYDNKELLRNDR